ncbi:MAG: LLM class flavin-dependent oxidoreductase [Deltaproteobacteria bacterium]|nr:LLM class flavin-dependent oxidoreductase [Deltaproteobacteria bacterium]
MSNHRAMSSSVIIGRGPQAVACGELWLERGHTIRCVVTACPELRAWCQKRGLQHVEPQADLLAVLANQPFDYLFSIVNHAITQPAVLALPTKAAINYHDSLLPAYGGFNATAWAILDGQANHGITWHRMSADVDAGAPLLQKALPIADDDTAFGLAARAGELAVRAFAELVAALEQGDLEEAPARPVHDFHFRSQRPGFAVLDFTEGSPSLLRLVRGLDFGNEDNWMTRAKAQTPTGEFLCVASAAPASTPSASPGTVIGVDDEGFVVATRDGALRLELTSLSGQGMSLAQLRALGVVVGAHMPTPTLRAVAESFDAAVTNKERYWVKRLQQLAPACFGECKTTATPGPHQQVTAVLPATFTALPVAQQEATLAAAVAAYLARVGDELTRVDLGQLVAELPQSLQPLYADVVPLCIPVAPETSWASLVQQTQQQLHANAERKTYARDVFTRYGALRGRSGELPVAITSTLPQSLPRGIKVLVGCTADRGHLGLLFDSAALSRVHAERLAARLTHVIAEATPDAPVSALPIVTAEERERLLHTLQDTERAFTPACIHHLFAAQAARTPQATALVFRSERLSYAELDERSNALAHQLVAMGVGPDQLVAIYIERSLEMVVGLLAILKAGGAYVPLDPAYPQERLAMMLEDSGARWLLTQSHLAAQLPHHKAAVVLVGGLANETVATTRAAPQVDVQPHHLAYVIFTSGSTGRPKGVMIEHRNVANFFVGMDERVGQTAGTWLAVTSVSFDISVLELFWTLSRGFKVVIQEEGDRASLLKAQTTTRATSRPMGFGLFYFAADSAVAGSTNAYQLMLEGARFADTHDFVAVWTPERHFHAFGGLYPNAAVTSAAIAAITKHVQVRAGSVVIPLHDPIRVAEDWAVVDNLSGGRVGLSFASGWHANDFALKPENFAKRHEVMRSSIETVLKLWRGEKIAATNGNGEAIEISVLPRPVRARPPMWIASAGNIETFRMAGRQGYNVLTNMLGQDLKDLAQKFAAYREARAENGHTGEGTISVMLHTFVTDSDDKARALSRQPFGNYLKSSYDLVKVAPWMFPAFKKPSNGSASLADNALDEGDLEALLDHAFDRYFDTAGLFGTPARALRLVEQLKDIGATEVACLIDFGIDPQVVLANLQHLDELRRMANPAPADDLQTQAPVSIREQFEAHKITHFQCTPSMARILVADGTIGVMGSLQKWLIGGEALPADLAATITRALPHTEVVNMYGPTETTVWSTTAVVRADAPITIGTPIANTQIRLLDKNLALAPLGTAAELCIGGASVVRGYLHQPELTASRFIADPFAPGNRLYRTGDLARYRDDGNIEYIGRMDGQVKVNGYRIELGEIETILGKHPAVKEGVVAVKQNASGPMLVAYVVPSGQATQSAATEVQQWQKRWEEAYATKAGAAQATPRFDTSGWLSSYTGEPIAASHMRAWLDETVTRILALQPKRVLEIGCGTGMLLYACLPHVEHYTALDLSSFALESIRAELTPAEQRKVTLLNRPAHEIDVVPQGSFDLVIINSVAQYFPNAAYLEKVLQQAGQALVDGGKVFLGDVRSLEEAQTFATVVQLHKAPGQMDAQTLAARIAERVQLDPELLLAGGFFAQLPTRVPRLTCISIELKRGQHANEMRDFRSDVVLQAGSPPPTLPRAVTIGAPDSLAALQAAVGTQPLVLCEGITNARLAAVHEVLRTLDAKADTTVDALRAALERPRGAGLDPTALPPAFGAYEVHLRFGAQPGTFDALFRHKQSAPAGVWPPKASGNAPVCSTPHSADDTATLAPKLKAHIRDFLPEYMVPAAFVFMPVFPLTPNGKIDRKALPLPAETSAPQAAVDYVVPANELERQIAQMWSEMLGVPRVGRKDNIFDLGASSLLTVEANGRLQKTLGRKIPLVTMFRYPTIESLASHLAKAIAAEAPAGAPTAPSAEDAAELERKSRLQAAADRRRQARTRST